MNVLVTGAAGYIGSVVTEVLLHNGHRVLALDNLQQGHRAAVNPAAVFIQADLSYPEMLSDIFKKHDIDAVAHLAAETLVEYSMTDPRRFFQANVLCGMNLIDAMLESNIYRLVFSSTAAVYGEPDRIPIYENDVTKPVNAYGESKLIFERILDWYGRAYGLKCISLRYFNAAGASDYYGEHHEPETHLIPNVLDVALGRKDHVQIFGDDNDTKDGTCIRDYIHVLDIAEAHHLALQKLDVVKVNKAYNLGNGNGYSVKQLVEMAMKVTEVDIPIEVIPRRVGDPAVLVANAELIKTELGWKPKYCDLEEIIGSAWQWQSKHPHGYSK